MLKLKVLGKVLESGLVAIVRTNSSDQAARIAEACALGGAAAIEITFTVPGAATVIEDGTVLVAVVTRHRREGQRCRSCACNWVESISAVRRYLPLHRRRWRASRR